MADIVLASQSPRRKQILEWAEIDFEIIVEPTDESFPEGLDPKNAAIHVARQKAIAIKEKVDNKIIIAADTMVVLKNEIIGKPSDREHAISILQKLRGKMHHVITGVYMANQQKEVFFSDVTKVEFNRLSDEQISFYVDKYQPYDKAGAYAIQEWIGVVGIKSISGDFYNVMGLPVSRVIASLDHFRE